MTIASTIIAYPKESVVVISVLVTLIMTLITKKFTNQERIKELKKIQKECNAKMKENRQDTESQKKALECSMEMMKHSMKPMFITFIPLILVFWWIRTIFAQTTIAGSWIWWYIIASIVSSIFLRKVLKVE